MSVVSYALNSNWDSVIQGNTLATLALSQLNASASTVQLVEIQTSAAELANPAEQNSCFANGLGAGTYWDFFCPQSGGRQALYATGSFPGGQAAATASLTRQPVHSAGSNYLAYDGHVKFLLASRVSVGENAPQASAPQNNNGGTCTNVGNCTAAGTAGMDNGGGAGSAVMTFSTL